ncbi:PAAR domain-containing protein [Duganella qianjiadongensis]|uniref:PAAR domain-containing protein n=1 Tax=Duganella qianjiadongensis TaxID=2692176 RepID=UPI001E404EFB|nr:PAAR domain-containing protein [Duganella qianjiadongensis]
MKRYTITLGASTTVGGKVISASGHGSINGFKIALEEDVIFCPACKSQGKIVCTGPRITETWNGANVALENDLCLCGCPSPPKLVPNQSVRYQIIEESETDKPQTAVTSTAGGPQADEVGMFDDRYILIDEETGEPLINAEYALMRQSGVIEFGTTDLQGHTHLLAAMAEAELIQIYS